MIRGRRRRCWLCLDADLSLSDAADVLGVLRTITGARRLPVLVGLTDPILVQMFAHRVLALDRGALVFDGTPGEPIGRRQWLPTTLASSA